jgi:putative oxidoreductase
MMQIDRHGRMPVSATLLLTRLVVAFIFLWHGLPKALNPDAAVQKFVGFGLPGWLGPATGAVEVIAAALLALGVFHTAAAVALVVVIAGALVTVQIPGGFTAGLERDLLILAATLTLAAAGPGQFAWKRDPNRGVAAGDTGPVRTVRRPAATLLSRIGGSE